MSYPCRSKALRVTLPILAAGLALSLAGCAVSPSAGSNDPVTPAKLPSIQGLVHGGQQPVTGSTIQLWKAGATGYGSPATALISATVTTSDGTGVSNSNANAGNANNTLPAGSFNITGDYTCTGDSFLYLTATGGNPGSGINSAVQLVDPLGPCSNLTSTSYFVINEITTAASALALGQYFTTTFGSGSTDSFGAPVTTQGQLGFTNAFATASNLVSINSGAAATAFTLTGAGATVTATPETSKLITIANILGSCVNSTGPASTSCATLFSSVVAPTGTAPTDTLQAAVYMSLNPTSNSSASTNNSTTNLAALYGLQTAQPAFSGGVTVQPTDWTVGIQYTDTTINTFMTDPQNIAADSSGNIWVVNSGSTSSLVELSPTGTPLANLLTSSTAGTGIAGANPRNIAIDTNNDVWVTTTSGSGYVFEYTAGGSVSSYATGKSAWGLAIDGSNDVFVGQGSSSDHFQIVELPSANIATPIVYPIAAATPGTAGTNGSSTYLEADYMAFDTAGNLWITDGGASTTTVNEVVQLSNINISACTPYVAPAPCPAGSTSGTPLPTSTTENTYTTFDPTTMSSPYGLAANSNGMWVANSGTGNDTVTNLALSGASGTSYGTSTTLSAPRFVAVDGAGNVWLPNHNASSPGAVSEFSSAGTVLSPTAGGAPFNVGGFSHAGLNSSLGVTIDPSGNVWVANNVSGTGGVFEIVGAAAPTVTPIALALKNSAVAAKP